MRETRGRRNESTALIWIVAEIHASDGASHRWAVPGRPDTASIWLEAEPQPQDSLQSRECNARRQSEQPEPEFPREKALKSDVVIRMGQQRLGDKQSGNRAGVQNYGATLAEFWPEESTARRSEIDV